MSEAMKTNAATRATLKQLHAMRKEAGLKIDPATAKTCWIHAQVLDTYGDGTLTRRRRPLARPAGRL
jgi:hypothetical protein